MQGGGEIHARGGGQTLTWTTLPPFPFLPFLSLSPASLHLLMKVAVLGEPVRLTLPRLGITEAFSVHCVVPYRGVKGRRRERKAYLPTRIPHHLSYPGFLTPSMPQYLRNPWMQSRRPFYPPIPARIVYGYDGIMGQGWIVGHTVAPFHSTVSPAVFMPSETQDQPSIQGGKPSLSPDHQAKRKGPVAEGTISYLDEPNPPEVMYIYTMEQANAWAKETR